MMKRDGEVVEADVAIGVAADPDQVLVDLGGADDLAAVGASAHVAEEEGHLAPPYQ